MSTIARLERGGWRSASATRSHKWRKHVNAIDFLENLDVANISQSTADEVQFSCPFPDHTHGDNTPSAYMNDGSKDPDQTTAWKCYGCRRGGNAVTFLAEYQNISKQEASKQLQGPLRAGLHRPEVRFDRARVRDALQGVEGTSRRANSADTGPGDTAQVRRGLELLRGGTWGSTRCCIHA